MKKVVILLVLGLMTISSTVFAKALIDIPFSDGSGTVAADISGNKNNAVLSDGCIWVKGDPTDSTFSLAPLSRGGAVTGPVSLKGATDLTVEFWARWTEAYSDVQGQITIPLVKHPGFSINLLTINEAQNLSIIIWKIGDKEVGTYWTGFRCDSMWHHIAAVYKGKTGLMTLYLDGQPTYIRFEGNSAFPDNTYTGGVPQVEGPITIGGAATEKEMFFKGQIARIRVWDEALTVDRLDINTL